MNIKLSVVKLQKLSRSPADSTVLSMCLRPTSSRRQSRRHLTSLLCKWTRVSAAVELWGSPEQREGCMDWTLPICNCAGLSLIHKYSRRGPERGPECMTSKNLPLPLLSAMQAPLLVCRFSLLAVSGNLECLVKPEVIFSYFYSFLVPRWNRPAMRSQVWPEAHLMFQEPRVYVNMLCSG